MAADTMAPAAANTAAISDPDTGKDNGMGTKMKFTVLSLLRVVGIVFCLAILGALITGLWGPPINRRAKQALCGANLNGLGKALALYKSENKESYPWLVDSGTTGRGMAFDAPLSKPRQNVYQLVSSASATNVNILDNLHLLVSTHQTAYKAFLCPSTGEHMMKRGGGNENYGWVSADPADNDGRPYINYAYQIGYSFIGDSKIPNPAALTDQLDGGVVILADAPVAPRTTEIDTDEFSTDSSHKGYAHGKDGVYYLYASGGAAWSNQTIRCGWGKNNIYVQDVTCTKKPEGDDDVVNEHAPGGNKITYKVTSASSRYDSVLFWGK